VCVVRVADDNNVCLIFLGTPHVFQEISSLFVV